MIDDSIRRYKADDVGTRMQHYMELQEMWSTAYEIVTRENVYHTELEKEQASQLTVALTLLQRQLEAEYKSTAYAKEINSLPKPTQEIK